MSDVPIDSHPPDRFAPEGSSKRKRRRNRGRGRGEEGGLPPAAPLPEAVAGSWDPGLFEVAPASGRVRFHDLELPVEVMHAIADLGFEYCTPIQAAALPEVLEGRDLFGRAQTGTGKSAAFLISMLTRLHREVMEGRRRKGRPRALIVAPTRELVMQIEGDAQGLARYLPLKIVAVYGGMDFDKQERELRGEPVDIMAATPGRLLDFERRGVVSLGDVRTLVIDEADRMLDMGFLPDVSTIIRRTASKHERHTMLFSATLTPEVRRLAAQWTVDPVTIEIEPEQVAVDTVEPVTYIVTDDEKLTLLVNLVVKQGLERVLVFCNRRDQTECVANDLMACGIRADFISGDVRQARRVKVLEQFRNGELAVLVATDVAARGIHIEAISHVVNFDLPEDAEDYVHRIGRTGRAGEHGISVSFASETDAFFLEPIEKFIGRKLTAVFPTQELLSPLPSFRRHRASRPSRNPMPGRSGPPRRGGRSGPPRRR